MPGSRGRDTVCRQCGDSSDWGRFWWKGMPGHREPLGTHEEGLEVPEEVWLVLPWRGIEICVTLSPWPAVKNQVTGSFILNPKGKEAMSRTFTAMGLEWEYVVEDAKESLKTSGPLPEAIAILVSPHPKWSTPLLPPPRPPQLIVFTVEPAQASCCSVFSSWSRPRPGCPLRTKAGGWHMRREKGMVVLL